MGILGGVSGDIVIRKLERIGYYIVRQKGSHVRLLHNNSLNFPPVSVPLHKELRIGTLKQIIKRANLTVEEFIKL
ncbi:MAG: hypothetical protein A2821_01515 [Candidatus Magasanikbacteria bacterium RIFCSPHIGHO2_01_FULL_41_23]|uniref:Addiction module toxin, HicA family n=1 Tax=Candidatus Magasanikbacteria bacterium RIFCSPLOWO2_01_FULL_40_15 TaxID=1798686 RepID=A0A1F6N4F5_9BACT|nr:MAG: hypothetical protein A2821_01515 [Candidatus Magasanikbacteria bacterium RIFCSPHIGHO2_01_FULL_41_23]OGH66798.1 MAG: hypothetical protein A3C66_01820 [Candidatus Magasanikbacteria bacterium RIFCSPHIGHO2_02_FULL_41_35]OGH76682.1 MAG: hypothetical protein A3F22_01105 [Candidatus Magasanikbacteria bacterium RIFCSPHIGHO2_12_FULL_41_16]OGH78885.1 MAG: hypothetical protein A2983_00975 [Candidatus Magasanikbacteria bacterium RIFCSPLOWO2_01_FULL_40_15]